MAGFPAPVDPPVKTSKLWKIACWTELLVFTQDLSVRFTPRFRHLLLVVLSIRRSTFNELLVIDYALIVDTLCSVCLYVFAEFALCCIFSYLICVYTGSQNFMLQDWPKQPKLE